MRCKYCSQPTSAISQVCQKCLLSQHGWPYDSEYVAFERWEREKQRALKEKHSGVQP